jgi:hypothetical protein
MRKYELTEDKEFVWNGSNFVEVGAVPQKNVEEAAYYRWLNAGKPIGDDWKFWFETEKDVFGLTQGDLQKFIDKSKE